MLALVLLIRSVSLF